MIKIKYLITIAILCAIATTVSGTMWENQMPDFLQIGSQYQFTAPIFKPTELSPFEIINAPYFPLLGEGFYTSAAPLQPTTQNPTVTVNSTGKVDAIPPLDGFQWKLREQPEVRGVQVISTDRSGQQLGHSEHSLDGQIR